MATLGGKEYKCKDCGQISYEQKLKSQRIWKKSQVLACLFCGSKNLKLQEVTNDWCHSIKCMIGGN